MDDDLDIPEFLRRDKGTPAVKADDTPPARDNEPIPCDLSTVRDNAAVPAVDGEAEKWRIMEQQRRDQRKVKARARVAKMIAVKADRNAAAAGKTWNTIKGRWE